MVKLTKQRTPKRPPVRPRQMFSATVSRGT